MAPAIQLHQGGCRGWVLPGPPRLVVSNPPWGQRLLGGNDFVLGGSSGMEGGEGGEAGGEGRGQGQGQGDAGVDDWWDSPAAAAEGGAAGRRDEGQGLMEAWHDLSVFLKEQCGGADAYLLSGSAEATQGLRLRADRRWPLSIGGVDCRLLKYSVRGRAPAGAASSAAAAGR